MKYANVFKALSYVGPLFLISLFIEQKNDPGIKLHCSQGMLLFVIGVISGIVLGVVTTILAFIPFIGWIIALLLNAATSIVLFVLTILGIVNGATNKDVPLPVIGRFAFYK